MRHYIMKICILPFYTNKNLLNQGDHEPLADEDYFTEEDDQEFIDLINQEQEEGEIRV